MDYFSEELFPGETEKFHATLHCMTNFWKSLSYIERRNKQLQHFLFWVYICEYLLYNSGRIDSPFIDELLFVYFIYQNSAFCAHHSFFYCSWKTDEKTLIYVLDFQYINKKMNGCIISMRFIASGFSSLLPEVCEVIVKSGQRSGEKYIQYVSVIIRLN